MHLQLLVLSLVGSRLLLEHLEEVLLPDPSKGWQVGNQGLLICGHLADKVSVHESLTVFQVLFEQIVQNLIKLLFAFSIDESVLENSRGLVNEDFYETLWVANVISQDIINELSDGSWGVEVVSVHIDRKLLLNLSVQFNKELRQPL